MGEKLPIASNTKVTTKQNFGEETKEYFGISNQKKETFVSLLKNKYITVLLIMLIQVTILFTLFCLESFIFCATYKIFYST